jgi:hypothetical protein
VTAAINMHATIEELLEVVFSVRAVPRLYNEDQLSLEYENTIQQHPNADAVMEHVHRVFTAIASLAGYTPASVSESPKWILTYLLTELSPS